VVVSLNDVFGERVHLLVVVDVTLSSWVCGLGCLESNADKVLTEDVVKDASTEATVLLELRQSQCLFQKPGAWRSSYHLVDDVPSVDLTLVAAHGLADVVLHDAGQGGLVPDRGDPAGQLRVPHGSVTTDELAIVLCELGSLIGGAEVEGTTLRLDGIPLHAIR
jgi:hypothetical protein